jgi:hypothetical protein
MPLKQILQPTIELKNIKIDLNKSINKVNVEDVASDIGQNLFLYLHRNDSDKGGIIIDLETVRYVSVNDDEFLPYIKLSFIDNISAFVNFLYPDDNTILSVYKKSNYENVMVIRSDFVITNYEVLKMGEGDMIKNIILYGELWLPDIRTTKTYRGNSLSILKVISSEIQCGFVTNVSSTNDDMLWINNGNYVSSFMKFITKRSFIDMSSFFVSFIDIRYNFNFINVENQFSDNPLDQKNIFGYTRFSLEEKITNLFLTNHPNMKGSNVYFEKYNNMNDSRFVNTILGYEHDVYYYNKTNNTLERKDVDTIVDEIKNDNVISLKTLDSNYHKRKSYDGKIDEDNMHPNYLVAYRQNIENIEFLNKMKISILLEMPNLFLYRYQHVEVLIYDLNNFYNIEVTEEIKTDSDQINDKLSGSWLITGINYIYNKNGLKQEIILVKKSMYKKYDRDKLDKLTKNFYLNTKK